MESRVRVRKKGCNSMMITTWHAPVIIDDLIFLIIKDHLEI